MPTGTPTEKFAVLLADDSDDDRFFMRKAIGRNPRFVVVGEVQDGEEAIAYLSGRGEYGKREEYPFPDVLLLDLKMPRKTGHEVLEWLQSQSFKQLRVIVISGSVLPEDIIRSRALGADAYLKKSPVREEQMAMVREIEAVCNRAKILPLPEAKI
jgi:CheY-like chemotaxis protein